MAIVLNYKRMTPTERAEFMAIKALAMREELRARKQHKTYPQGVPLDRLPIPQEARNRYKAFIEMYGEELKEA